jgi:hypothetical protein
MGDAFKPSAQLEKLVAEGKKFSDLKYMSCSFPLDGGRPG